MLHTRDAISFRGGRRVFHSAVLAALTMAAMLLCLLAVHSAGAGHGLGHAPGQSTSSAPAAMTATTAMPAGAHSAAAHSSSSSSAASSASSAPFAAPFRGALLERVAPAAATAVSLVVATISSADTDALSGPAALAMTCSLLVVLSALILLSHPRSAFRRLLEAGAFVVGSFREIPLHLHRPSLTLLSISRI